ncbi:flowering-promoting factor 1-like protein 2 [Populus alba x Populus x berolinensis]|uniref:Flowering-promoting factor 1-like protein 2 n=1 Tax=Populus alba x Populus x berolinensis TaxID=444605 RepID=A0AAD6QS22_9ROSI|nr:flowering-promoting factor 1-like protein 2 [Populus alba x Populus x berolinensis]
MSGVWVFKNNGVIRLVENPAAASNLGWERYYGGDPDLFQFHKHASIDLISLPRDFSKFNSVYMYDIVIKNPNMFHVRDM